MPTAQLLFMDTDTHTVNLDVIVLADEQDILPVGQPMAMPLLLPEDDDWRGALVKLLESWTEELAIVDLEVVHRKGKTAVRVASPSSSVLLDVAS